MPPDYTDHFARREEFRYEQRVTTEDYRSRYDKIQWGKPKSVDAPAECPEPENPIDEDVSSE